MRFGDRVIAATGLPMAFGQETRRNAESSLRFLAERVSKAGMTGVV